MLLRFEAPSSDESASEQHNSKRRKTKSESSSYSGSDSYSGSGSDRESNPAVTVVNTSGLLLSQLIAMNEGQQDGHQSVYSTQGTNVDRIKSAMKETCCKRQCKRLLHWKLVLQMATFFWALPKVSQDCVLWSLQQRGRTPGDGSGSESESESESGGKQHKISWSIEGLVVKN